MRFFSKNVIPWARVSHLGSKASKVSRLLKISLIFSSDPVQTKRTHFENIFTRSIFKPPQEQATCTLGHYESCVVCVKITSSWRQEAILCCMTDSLCLSDQLSDMSSCFSDLLWCEVNFGFESYTDASVQSELEFISQWYYIYKCICQIKLRSI